MSVMQWPPQGLIPAPKRGTDPAGAAQPTPGPRLLDGAQIQRAVHRLARHAMPYLAQTQNPTLLGLGGVSSVMAQRLQVALFEASGLRLPLTYLDVEPWCPEQDYLSQSGAERGPPVHLEISGDQREFVIVDGVIGAGRGAWAALLALHEWLSPKKVHLLTLIDQGQRILPIQPDVCALRLQLARTERLRLCLRELDGEDGLFLERAEEI